MKIKGGVNFSVLCGTRFTDELIFSKNNFGTGF